MAAATATAAATARAVAAAGVMAARAIAGAPECEMACPATIQSCVTDVFDIVLYPGLAGHGKQAAATVAAVTAVAKAMATRAVKVMARAGAVAWAEAKLA